MKIMICSSKHFYNRIPPIQEGLEERGHQVTLPNSYERPSMEEEQRLTGEQEHRTWKREMIELSSVKIAEQDAILVLNFGKNGMKNYIGGATFLEVYDAFRLGKKVFFYNPLPEGIFNDELQVLTDKVINGRLEEII